MKKKHFYTAVILLAFLAIGIQPAFADIIFPNDTNYFDHVENTNLYTLKGDVSDTIILTNPNGSYGNPTTNRIIFDGGGHTVSVSNGHGISFYEYNEFGYNGYITIQNINITDCYNNGIDIVHAKAINVINTNISSCHNNGIWIGIAGTCIIHDNTISDCDEYGIALSGGINNTIYNNNFVNNNFIYNGPQAYAASLPEYPSTGNVFDGNYWSDWTGTDSNGDGIGDSSYTFSGGQDSCPWILPNGWSIPPLSSDPDIAILDLIGYVTSMNLQNGIDNSLDAKLDAALNALDEIGDNNDVAAINSLSAFINAVEAQRGNKISNEDAEFLIAAANYIISLL